MRLWRYAVASVTFVLAAGRTGAVRAGRVSGARFQGVGVLLFLLLLALVARWLLYLAGAAVAGTGHARSISIRRGTCHCGGGPGKGSGCRS